MTRWTPLLLFMMCVTACAHPSVTRQTIETIPAAADARTHIPPAAFYDYGTPFPTSGPHSPRWTETGFYSEPQRPTELVHALEHGNIVIYYDQSGTPALQQLKGWADEHQGQWDGVVVVPSPGLKERVVLTAWEKRLQLKQFDAAAAAAFLDAFRGRGPEGAMR
ncbi:MAG: hypothetical protein K0S81_3551 [Rhodospirillales bacterium]|nr:hypothetical protein [Rhodospirillales bacterium]